MRKEWAVAAIVVAVLTILGLVWLYLDDRPYSKPSNWLTYQSTDVPFSFDYPPSWVISKKADDNNPSDSPYVYITLTNKSVNKETVEIKYGIFGNFTFLNYFRRTDGSVNCETKEGPYQRDCSYIVNPQINKGYFYGEKKANIWRGNLPINDAADSNDTVGKVAAITISLLDNKSEGSLINIAKSIKATE